MTYKPEWKGRLHVTTGGAVYFNSDHRGQVGSKQVEGAKSPGGMITNQVWMAIPVKGLVTEHAERQRIYVRPDRRYYFLRSWVERRIKFMRGPDLRVRHLVKMMGCAYLSQGIR